MKKQVKLSRSLMTIALVTVTILMIPFVAMQFTSEVNWSVADFLIMGALISGTGLTYVLINRFAPNWVYRIAIIVALGTTFLMIWANMAVGLIGSGPNAGNIMYAAIVLVVVIGILFSRLRSSGMERTMYAMVSSLIILTGIALLSGMNHYPGSSSSEIVSVGAFFAALFLLSGLLFHAAKNPGLAQPAS
ncbi:hypothetical protein U0035_03270 [Niabella yanshanensis]|uniref:Uncharacterized protein n=1 Tax=Niabella yanshanensis TaxID=577386 RepID=A0ABZ0W793_9BACT|nr:hypothetical protein [Niabella yanshanensis]WQD39168.1 hypothetical protein U0035_03270 [Niabella yanshanensis]